MSAILTVTDFAPAIAAVAIGVGGILMALHASSDVRAERRAAAAAAGQPGSAPAAATPAPEVAPAAPQAAAALPVLVEEFQVGPIEAHQLTIERGIVDAPVKAGEVHVGRPVAPAGMNVRVDPGSDAWWKVTWGETDESAPERPISRSSP